MISAFGVEHALAKGWSAPAKSRKLIAAFKAEQGKRVPSAPPTMRETFLATRLGAAQAGKANGRPTHAGFANKGAMRRSLSELARAQKNTATRFNPTKRRHQKTGELYRKERLRRARVLAKNPQLGKQSDRFPKRSY